MKRQLVLEDGTTFIGKAFGSEEKTIGEVVFNTGMTGYQEILSDPSYCGQIITLTYPLIGNYGVNRDDFESIYPALKGLIVKEHCDTPSNWRSQMSLHEYMKSKNIPGLAGIDTRKLTRKIRQYGTLRGAFCSITEDPLEVAEQLTRMSLPSNQVQQVSTKTAYANPGRGYRIVLMDFGMKHGILRELTRRDCDVVVVPYNTSAEDIIRLSPDGIMLSNGPGDPKDVPEAVDTIRNLVGKVPIFGICLGHQLFALASGANTEKLKFGHRGSNHPVKDLRTGKVAITSQNHGYTVTESSILRTQLTVTHVALNDGTIEGLCSNEYPAFTVQYHPEASPGPDDANGLFDEFMTMIQAFKRKGNTSCLNA
ncbi:carbamoyl-phosphate synthase small subunit [Bacillus sp. HMF5848]|uniref:carbamoyl phosphate synthase small subunit n=1 Tax=Bacillus sp. HMF5848 TaxID=2495421 RepID=UPI000F78DD4A|nr:carbamoyl phosphate synthase small subunit [Bacillus sp. HMF5848]RSK26965.1 carbamoyl-phosphate synthase small subunit [Bacillus sp. HMF5848]